MTVLRMDNVGIVVDDLDRTIREIRTVIFGLQRHGPGSGLRDEILALWEGQRVRVGSRLHCGGKFARSCVHRAAHVVAEGVAQHVDEQEGAGRERYRFYRERGYELRAHDMSERGS